ncbi:MAG: AsmA-like C-terminal domain-containing protein, partial [Rhodovibrionaceae bacterium]|nr:AsmA-like C-terminal domain-containing protein [Rhodovibrionaceae bacterium]
FFPELPPITGIDGQATFDMAGVYLEPAGGRVGELQLRESTVDLIGFQTADQTAVVDVNVDGPVPRFLELLSHPRLDLLSGLGISAEGTEGTARVGAYFSIPLLDAVTFDDITVKAQAQLADAAAPAVMMGLDLTDGQLDLVVDKAHMLLRGPGRIADVPLTFEWRENFSDAEELTRSVQATVPSLGAYGREVLGLEAAPYLTGPIALEVDYRAARGGIGQVAIEADFTAAGLSLPFMNWRKDPGDPADGRGIVELEGDEIVHIGALEIDGERFHAEGDVYFAGDGVPERLSLSRFVAGRSDLHDLELMRKEGGLHLTIGRGRLDARPFLEDLESPAKEDAEESSEGEDPPLLVEAPNLDPIIMGKDRRIENASLKLERKREGWVLISLSGDLPGELRRAPRSKPGPENDAGAGPPPPVPIQFYYGPDGNEGVALSADSEDFGATLRVFDLLDTIEGGQFQLRGGRPPNSPDKPLKAALSVSEFTMVEAPVMARILSIASLTGASDLLSGEGIRFTEATGNLRVKDGKISSKLLRAHGPALGLTAKGEVDLVADAIDVEGTVVPAYSVNRFLGKIPLLGRVLTGGEGEGVVAVTYKVRGPVTEPEVSVNPLSVLTPGFLRGVFNIFDGEAPPKDSEVSVYPEIQNTP